jgi:PAS domain S-box-containing protein
MEPNVLQEKLDKALRENEKLENRIKELDDFLENGTGALHWVNGSGVVIWANRADYELLGYTREEYIGNHIAKFHADKHVIEDILNRLMNRETIKNYPARLLRKNGGIKHVLINSNVMWKGEEFVHTRCFTRDISELKEDELTKVEMINVQAEQIMKLKQEIKSLKDKLKK